VRIYFFALVLAVASAGLIQASPAATTGPTVTKPAPAQQKLPPDAVIERNIKAKLAKSKMAATEHFTVSVHSGVATFEGKTNVIQHKGVATRMAKSSGAVAVQNNIQVSDAAKAKAAAKLANYRMPPGGPVRAAVVQPAK
jgi:osmotically-inducible protein OsmY